MAKKKSYNPFRMWGSYVGIVLGLLISFIPSIIPITSTESIFLTNFWVVLPISTISGFLIGYGIHILIRRIKK